MSPHPSTLPGPSSLVKQTLFWTHQAPNMAAEDTALATRDAPIKPPPPLQPRSRKALETAKVNGNGRPASPLSHPPPVRPAPERRQSAIAYGQTMYGVGVSDVGALAAPRPKHELDKEELTTKGRKRKRLAKACSACHKNKRRCDGFAPCSNCEFSARPCIYLNAQGEQIPPPRTRDSSATPAAAKRPGDDAKGAPVYHDQPPRPGVGAVPDDWRRDYRDGAVGADWRGPLSANGSSERSRPFGPIDLVERDPIVQAELLEIALHRTPAFASMFHLPTFNHRLYLNRVQPFLLDALYMLGARLCDNPAFVAAFPADLPTHRRGRVFAERCRANIDHVIEVRQRWSEEERKMDQGTWEETEFVQSCILLSLHYNSLREARVGFFYLDVALSVLRPGTSGQLTPPSQRLNLSQADFFTLAEMRNRTFWMGVIQDICATASGHPRRVSDAELAAVPLPGPEIYWTRFGGMASNGREPGRRDTIAVGTGNWHAEEGQVGEVGHIVRILVIFSNIMVFVNSGDTRPMLAAQYEQALKSWALDLPRHLRFDEVNLSQSMGRVKSSVPEVAFNGWAFAYMHGVAECGMFYLQSKHAGAPFSVQRQGQAVDNLTVMIDALGERGREGPLMFFPIMIVTCWTDHVRATSPTAQQALLEERLNVWWAELYREWGWERRDTLERGIFPNLESPKQQAVRERERDDIPPTGRPRALLEPPNGAAPAPNHATFSSSPQSHQTDSSASSAASQSVVTPSEATASYSRYPVLPPLRRGGDRSPSPRCHRLDSIGSAGSGDRERERERESRRERSPSRERHSSFNLPPISAYRAVRDYNDERRGRSREGSHEPRPLAAPPTKRWATSGGPLLGIEALVTAAEEHRRESLEQPTVA